MGRFGPPLVHSFIHSFNVPLPQGRVGTAWEPSKQENKIYLPPQNLMLPLLPPPPIIVSLSLSLQAAKGQTVLRDGTRSPLDYGKGSCPYAKLIKHYTIKTYGGVDV
jgi:hypothetical protein